MKIIYIPILCICFFVSFCTHAQSLKKNQLGIELGGNNVFYSIYYQYNIPVEKHYIGLKLGITPYLPPYKNAVNAEINTTLGTKNRWFIGAGYTRVVFNDNGFNSGSFQTQKDVPFEMITPSVGYQILTSNQQNYWRFGVMALVQVSSKDNTTLDVPLWPSISFGWIFD